MLALQFAVDLVLISEQYRNKDPDLLRTAVAEFGTAPDFRSKAATMPLFGFGI